MRWKSTCGITCVSTRPWMREMSPAWMALSLLTDSMTSPATCLIMASGAVCANAAVAPRVAAAKISEEIVR